MTAYGDLSQARLTRVLRQYLWCGVVWLAMRMAASGLTSLFGHQELVLPDGSDELNTALSALKVCLGTLVTELLAKQRPPCRWCRVWATMECMR